MSPPPQNLSELFAATVSRHPERIAVDVPPDAAGRPRQQLSYRELDRRAGRVAAALQPSLEPAGREPVVIVLLARQQPWLFAAQLGVLRAGAAFTCPDVSHPDAHLRRVLQESGAVAVVTDAAGAHRFASTGVAVVRIEDLPAEPRAEQAPVPTDRLAYLVFTSGTTGTPKGVAVEHRSALRLILDDREHFGFTPVDRIAQGSSPAYDSSIEETWAAFACGATAVVMDADVARLGPDLVPWLRAERITVLMPPPTLLRTMGALEPAHDLPDLRLVYVGGEAMPQDLADRWGAALWLENGYGPTECTVTCLRGRLHPGEPVHVGVPVAGSFARVLDGDLQPVAAGETGELCMGGDCLARGYLGDAERTAARFVTLGDGARVYRSGDLVRQLDDGRFLCLGRIDQQVKVRGHRVELEAVEVALAAQPGVAAAACRLQGEGPAAQLVGFVVAAARGVPLDPAALRSALQAELPGPWVPSAIGLLDELPQSVGGKLDRRRLPELSTGAAAGADGAITVAEGPIEQSIAVTCAELLGRAEIDVTADLFDLGADSVRAAELVSRLRDAPATAGLAVRDVYEQRSVRRLATLAGADAGADRGATEPADADAGTQPMVRPRLVTALQALFLFGGLLVAATVAWLLWFEVLPRLVAELGLASLLVLAPLAAPLLRLLWLPVALLLTIAAKRLLIGRYREGRLPVWSLPWLRHWMVTRVAQTIPWGLLAGTVFTATVLRALGARIGRRVFIQRGADLAEGGWDLLRIDDDAVLGRDCRMGVTALIDRALHCAPVQIGAGAVVETRASVEGGSSLGSGSVLRALSHLPSGVRTGEREDWDGVPATLRGTVRDAPGAPLHGKRLAPALHGVTLIAARTLVGLLGALPGIALLLFALQWLELGDSAAVAWLLDPSSRPELVGWLMLWGVVAVPLGLLGQALLLRLTPGLAAGDHHLFGTSSLRGWLRSGVLERAGTWLSGAMFWPWWLRLAGMRVGPGCEISTITGVLPEQVTVGERSFFADGIYLGGPEPRADGALGAVLRVGPLRLGPGTFLGNHVVLRPRTELPPDLLLGVCTVGDPARMTAGSSWFGHPPFALPRREVVDADEALTFRPSLVRRLNRVCWELLRFVLPGVQLGLLLGWLDGMGVVLGRAAGPFGSAIGFAVASLLWAALAALLVLALKWSLLGRVRPGQHVLWSCWCSRWDFVYVAWQRLAAGPLASLQQTLLLTPYLRAMGMRIGRRVVLGQGFAQVVDPDMLSFADGATVDGLFQAHSFEDRVLKIGRVTIGPEATLRRGAVVMYGAELGAGCRVEPHAVVMKREKLLAGRSHAGVPTRPGPRVRRGAG